MIRKIKDAVRRWQGIGSRVLGHSLNHEVCNFFKDSFVINGYSIDYRIGLFY